MKKILLVIALISMCCGCSCGNKELFDTTYTYDKAICNIAGEWKEIRIKKWTDYEGEQIQIWDKEDNYYLVSSVSCTLMKESD